MATIRKRRGKWQVQIRRMGQPPSSKTFLLRADAVTWARQVDAQADRAGLPVGTKALRQFTLGDLIKRYRDTITSEKKTATNETIVLNAFLRHRICEQRLSELGRSDFAAYAKDRLKTVCPATLQRELVPIKHMLKVACLEWQLPLSINLLDRTNVNFHAQPRERRLRDNELQLLLTSAQQCRNRLITPVILIAYETGMRRGEILAIRGFDLDGEERSLTIPKTKTGYSRKIPLTEKAFVLLRDLKINERELIFPVSPNALRLAWEHVKKRAGIDDLRFHDLRHEAISRFFEMGLSMPEVASISGHRDPRMLFRYAHANLKIVREKLSGSKA
jgi:integrase